MLRPLRRNLRTSLAESHTAAVAIAVLLVWSLQSSWRALWPPVSRLLELVATAVAIFNIPYLGPSLITEDRTSFAISLLDLGYAAIALIAASVLSRWVYGLGALRMLQTYRTRLVRRKDA